jgi:membrane associated rhomboid family serine protease
MALQRTNEPILNAPAVVAWTIAALVAIHAARTFLSSDEDTQILLYFAFIPARYDATSPLAGLFPGGLAGDVWTFVTYSALHGDWMHLGVNALWLLAFGSAVAWRFGGVRFLLFMAATAACGAGAHLLTHSGETVPMIGASGAISGMTAAAIRFVFEPGAPMGQFRKRGYAAYAVPAVPVGDLFRSKQIVTFLIVWFGINLLYAVSSLSLEGENTIAWQTHIGGFLSGLFLFPLFDPRNAVTAAEVDSGS